MITHREKGVVCDVCGEEVADKRALINHKASHSNTVSVSRNSLTEKVFPCSSCGKVSDTLFINKTCGFVQL